MIGTAPGAVEELSEGDMRVLLDDWSCACFLCSACDSACSHPVETKQSKEKTNMKCMHVSSLFLLILLVSLDSLRRAAGPGALG